MNETELYRDTVLQEIVDDDKIKRCARTAAPKKRRAVRIWKPVAITFAALLVAFGVTMTIPAARAEVLSWFDPANARDYLAQDPEDREPVPELDAMIAASENSYTEIRVNCVADEPYWREIGEHFSAVLGETFYDGNEIYVSIDFVGLSGYPLFDNTWCPSLPADALLPTYLSEEIGPEQWNEPDNQLYLTAENGVSLPAWIEPVSRPVDEAFIQAFYDRFGSFDSFDEEAASAWREDVLAHCKTNGVRAVATAYPELRDSQADLPIDENGYLTLQVHYYVWFNRSGGGVEKLNVDLGTVTVNMTAYKDLHLTQRSIEATQDTIALACDAIWYDHRNQQRCTANLYGVTLRVITPGTVDLLGVHGIEILAQLPDGWSEEQKESFLKGLLLTITVGDDLVIDCGGGVRRSNDGSYILFIELDGCIPFSRIRTVQRITLAPMLFKDDLTPLPVDPIVLTLS